MLPRLIRHNAHRYIYIAQAGAAYNFDGLVVMGASWQKMGRCVEVCAGAEAKREKDRELCRVSCPSRFL